MAEEKQTPVQNTGWRHVAFRTYADYMETPAFKDGIMAPEQVALKQRTVYMCSKALWWRCHRSMVSDYLKLNGWRVLPIIDIEKATEHPYAASARIVKNELNYEKETGSK